MATAPRSTAERDRRAEPNLPTGVLTAATITERVINLDLSFGPVYGEVGNTLGGLREEREGSS
jgi:hypothetical protein